MDEGDGLNAGGSGYVDDCASADATVRVDDHDAGVGDDARAGADADADDGEDFRALAHLSDPWPQKAVTVSDQHPHSIPQDPQAHPNVPPIHAGASSED